MLLLRNVDVYDVQLIPLLHDASGFDIYDGRESHAGEVGFSVSIKLKIFLKKPIVMSKPSLPLQLDCLYRHSHQLEHVTCPSRS